MEAVARAFDGSNVADGIASNDPFGHLVGEGLGVFQADQATELTGVHPVALGGGGLKVQQGFEVAQDHVEAMENFVQGGSVRIWTDPSVPSKGHALHRFLNAVGFDPALVGGLVDLEAVAHQAGPEVGGDAAIQEA